MPYYHFPNYINGVGGFADDVRAVDANDGRIDGKWRTNDIATLLQGFDTPARIPYQTRVIERVIRGEGFGADDTPDLLFVNYKTIDYISHVWTMNSPEMQDAVAAQDAALHDFVDFLDATVGRGQWALVLTADHGSIPDPKVSGAFQISTSAIQTGINETFDTDGDQLRIVDLIQPTQVFVNQDELRQNGHTLEDVSEWIMGLTKGETALPTVSVPTGQAGDPVFQAAFPSRIMDHLPCLPEARG
jgi:predicted AlkP superfamily pyrophosphatase or phosphodiesterase